mmetsp:Transcript_440/g.634  ORF Transcript_440/g.634 Transcript_440/m.634 type:complete len:249 (+) Transcript_440:809-1555(+)
MSSLTNSSASFCNLYSLYCGSQDNCTVANTDLVYNETFDSCPQNDKSKCVVTSVDTEGGSDEGSEEGCKEVTTQENFDLEKFISAKWYVQQQMEVDYLPKSRNFCVTAEYSKRSFSFFGYTINVKNLAFESDKTTKQQGDLCASEDGSDDPAKLQVAPCFLPKAFAGPYWVVSYDEEQGYALISGGQPTIPGTNGCRTGSGTNNSGLWIFTRNQVRDDELVNRVRSIAQEKGFDISVLNDVDQTSCPV